MSSVRVSDWTRTSRCKTLSGQSVFTLLHHWWSWTRSRYLFSFTVAAALFIINMQSLAHSSSFWNIELRNNRRWRNLQQEEDTLSLTSCMLCLWWLSVVSCLWDSVALCWLLMSSDDSFVWFLQHVVFLSFSGCFNVFVSLQLLFCFLKVDLCLFK